MEEDRMARIANLRERVQIRKDLYATGRWVTFGGFEYEDVEWLLDELEKVEHGSLRDG